MSSATSFFLNNVGPPRVLHPNVVVNIQIGLSLFGVSGSMGIDLSAMHALTFSSLIAAVDPVAVSNN